MSVKRTHTTVNLTSAARAAAVRTYQRTERASRETSRANREIRDRFTALIDSLTVCTNCEGHTVFIPEITGELCDLCFELTPAERAELRAELEGIWS